MITVTITTTMVTVLAASKTIERDLEERMVAMTVDIRRENRRRISLIRLPSNMIS